MQLDSHAAAPSAAHSGTGSLQGGARWRFAPAAMIMRSRVTFAMIDAAAIEKTLASPSRRREFCHFTDTPCLSLLKHLIKVHGGCHQMTVSPTASVALDHRVQLLDLRRLGRVRRSNRAVRPLARNVAPG